MLAPCLALYEQISLPVAGLCTVTFFPVTFFPNCPLFLFSCHFIHTATQMNCYLFSCFFFFPLVHCYFLSCNFFSYLKQLLSFLFLIFPLVHYYFLSCYFFSYLKLLFSFLFRFFPLVHCYFLSCYFFSCYFFSYLKLLLSFLLPFFLLLSFRAPEVHFHLMSPKCSCTNWYHKCFMGNCSHVNAIAPIDEKSTLIHRAASRYWISVFC